MKMTTMTTMTMVTATTTTTAATLTTWVAAYVFSLPVLYRCLVHGRRRRPPWLATVPLSQDRESSIYPCLHPNGF